MPNGFSDRKLLIPRAADSEGTLEVNVLLLGVAREETASWRLSECGDRKFGFLQGMGDQGAAQCSPVRRPPPVNVLIASLDSCKAKDTVMRDQGDAPLESVVAELQKQMSKKQSFEGAVTSLISLLREEYSSASTSERSTLYNAVSKAATLLQSRYTAKGFWVLGLRLFEEALQVVSLPKEKKQIKSFIEKARSFVGEEEEQRGQAPASMRAGTSGGFLFEGQLTVDREPPPPSWLVAQNALTALLRNVPTPDEAQATTDGAGGDEEMREELEWGTEPYRLNLTRVEQELNLMGMEHEFGADDIARAIEATLQEGGHRAAPPASKDEVAKLRVEPVTTEVMKRLGEETECAVCREVFVGGESVQEMPCKHSFHPSCLKPWLDEHNSCPVCRYEMRTDDLEYELKKEADKEAEEERKGAANALRGGEFMYI